MTAMINEEIAAANRFNELPEETQKFLTRLQSEDIVLLEEGLKLVRATLTVGRFMKWVVIGLVAMLLGFVSLYENVVKVWGWFHPKP